jgi:hypothetical protein
MTVIVGNPSELSCGQQQVNERNQERRGDDERQDDFGERDHSGSKPFRPQQRVSEVKQQTERDEAGERVIDDHGLAPLQPFANVGIADACHEEAERECQHDDVQHGMFLCDVNCEPAMAIAFSGTEVPPDA